jgi:hypothetical protein
MVIHHRMVFGTTKMIMSGWTPVSEGDPFPISFTASILFGNPHAYGITEERGTTEHTEHTER